MPIRQNGIEIQYFTPHRLTGPAVRQMTISDLLTLITYIEYTKMFEIRILPFVKRSVQLENK